MQIYVDGPIIISPSKHLTSVIDNLFNLNFHHWLLIVYWIAYCCVHSLLAALRLKSYLQTKRVKFYRYYRLMYSIFAMLTLCLLLIYQYSFPSILLISSVWIKDFSLLIFVFPGLVIMVIAIYKYFRLLSGIRSLYEAKPPAELRIEGIHKYMRHPLYAGTLLFVWGLFLAFPFLNNLIAVTIITIYTIIGIQFEERKLEIEFGRFYFDYKSKVPMLIPFLRRGIK